MVAALLAKRRLTARALRRPPPHISVSWPSPPAQRTAARRQPPPDATSRGHWEVVAGVARLQAGWGHEWRRLLCMTDYETRIQVDPSRGDVIRCIKAILIGDLYCKTMRNGDTKKQERAPSGVAAPSILGPPMTRARAVYPSGRLERHYPRTSPPPSKFHNGPHPQNLHRQRSQRRGGPPRKRVAGGRRGRRVGRQDAPHARGEPRGGQAAAVAMDAEASPLGAGAGGGGDAARLRLRLGSMARHKRRPSRA